MLFKLRQRAKDERGFTLIELLVVILIIGILAAIAIPSFLNQKGKASDAGAKELAHTAQVAEETCATDNNGNYSPNCTSSATLNSYESTIQIGSTPAGNAYLVTGSGAGTGVQVPGAGQAALSNSYTVTAVSTNGDSFSITRAANGSITRVCTTSAGNVATGCPAGNSW
jgi:type IV pilus assembly protein PilA